MSYSTDHYFKLRHLADESSRVVCIPSLVSRLLAEEEKIGRPLTETEVLSFRDASPAVHMPTAAALAVDQKRGYDDIDPENPWPQWQEARRRQVEWKASKNAQPISHSERP